MALADPLPKSAFADLLRVSDIRFTLVFNQERSATGSGALYADRAPAMWRATITTPPMENAEAEGLMALINSRAGGIKTVLLYNNRLPYPSSDPTGSIFGAATPLVGTITNPLAVAFTGFPIGYVIPLGTYVGILFDTSRYYLGQFTEAKTADGSGAVSAVELAPPLPASVETGDAVTVLKPPAKFTIVPGSAFIASQSQVLASIQFEAEQSYDP